MVLELTVNQKDFLRFSSLSIPSLTILLENIAFIFIPNLN